jgi:1-hydroxycarotenoid 3,4-desaturase
MVFLPAEDGLRVRRVVIIGAGVGGLVAALRLAAEGLAVTLVESAPAPGGKMREIVVDGAPIDAGPTVFTMRWVFDEIFAEIGDSLADHVVLRPVETLARHAWGGAERLDLFADVARSAEAIGAFAGAREADGYLRFCRRARAVYATLRGPFIGASRPGPAELVRRVGLAGLGDLARISPFTTMWRALGGYFRDPRLRQLFGRYATYCGSSPFAAPATLMLVAHVEQDGVWIVEGGMHRLAAALAEAARARGATLRFGARAARILVAGGRAAGIEIAGGERLPAEAIVMNGDVAALADGRLGSDAAGAAPRTARGARSLSAVTWAIAAPAEGFPLLRHNVFFSRDYRAEFDDIFRRRRLPRRPTAYVCAQDRGDEGAAGAGGGRERLLCLVNAPADGDRGPIESSELQACEEATFQLLSRCGLTIDRRAGATMRTTPADFERLFPATGGALYGRVSHGWMASFARPGSRTRLPGLYLAGGSVHPGPGVPMAALSGRQAAASIITDLASTRRSIPAAMPGGMSTR